MCILLAIEKLRVVVRKQILFCRLYVVIVQEIKLDKKKRVCDPCYELSKNQDTSTTTSMWNFTLIVISRGIVCSLELTISQ